MRQLVELEPRVLGIEIGKHQLDIDSLSKVLTEKIRESEISLACDTDEQQVIDFYPVNDVFFFKLDSDSLQERGRFYFKNKDKLVAILENEHDICRLMIFNNDNTFDIQCSFEGKELSIQATGKVIISGTISVDGSLKIDAKSCLFLEHINHEKSFFSAKEMHVRTSAHLGLNKNTVFAHIEQLYLSSKTIVNQAKLYVDSLILAGEQINHLGDIRADDRADIITLNFSSHKKSITLCKKAYNIVADSYSQEGMCESSLFNVRANGVSISGVLKIKVEGIVLAEDTLAISKKASLTIKGAWTAECNGVIKVSCPIRVLSPKKASDEKCTVQFIASEALHVEDSLSCNSDKLILSSKKSIVLRKPIISSAKTHVYILGHDVHVDSDISGFSTIHIVAKDSVEIGGPVMVDQLLYIKSNQVKIASHVHIKNSFHITSHSVMLSEKANVLSSGGGDIECDNFLNIGKIFIKNTLNIGANVLVLNRGEMIADNLLVNASLYINLWSITGLNLLNINAMLSMSFGLSMAETYQHNALADFQLGVHLARPPSISKLLTLKSLKEFAKVLAKNTLPQTYQLFQLAIHAYEWLSPLFHGSFSEIIQSINQYFVDVVDSVQFMKSSLCGDIDEVAPFYKFIATCVKAKDTALFLSQSIDSAGKILKKENLDQSLSNIKHFLNQPDIGSSLFEAAKDMTDSVSISSLSLQYITSLLPTHTSSSMLQMNAGFSMSLNSLYRSRGLHFNAGWHASLISTQIDGQYITNEGELYSFGTISLSGVQGYNAGVISSQLRATLHFDSFRFAMPSDVVCSKWDLTATSCMVSDRVILSDSSVSVVDLTCETGSSLSLSHSSLVAQHCIFQASESQLDATGSSIKTRHIDSHGTVVLSNTMVDAEKIEQRGELQATQSSLRGQSIRLSKAQMQNSQTIAEGELRIEESHGNDSLYMGSQVTIRDSKLHGSSDPRISPESELGSRVVAHDSLSIERTDVDRTLMQAHTLTATESTASQSLLASEQEAVLTDTNTDESQVVAADIALLGESTVTRSTLVAKNTLQQEGRLQATNSNLYGEHVSINRASVTASNVTAEESLKVVETQSQDSCYVGKKVQLINTTHRQSAPSVDGQVGNMGAPQVDSHIRAFETLVVENADIEQTSINTGSLHLNKTTIKESTVECEADANLQALDISRSRLSAHNIDVSGKTTITETEVAARKTLHARGHITVSKSKLTSKNVIAKGNIESPDILEVVATKRISLSEGSRTSARQMILRSKILDHDGVLKAHDLGVSVDRLWNRGEIDIGNSALFDARQFCINFNAIEGNNLTFNTGAFINLPAGTIRGNATTINTGLYANILGDVAGSDHLNVNAIIAVNAGMMRSMNLDITAGVSLNLGVYVPTLPSSFFSWNAVSGVGKALLYSVSSPVGTAVSLISSGYQTCQHVADICSQVSDLYDTAKNDIGSVNIGKVVGLIATANKTLQSGGQEVNDDAFDAYIKTITPTVSTSTLVSANRGLMASATIRENGFLGLSGIHSYNSGVKISREYVSKFNVQHNDGGIYAYKTSICGTSFHNRGDLLSNALNLDVADTYNYGHLQSVTLQLKGQSYHNYGSTYAEKAAIELAGTLSNNYGTVRLDAGQIKADHLMVRRGAVMLSNTHGVMGTTSVLEDARLCLSNESHITTEYAMIDGTLAVDTHANMAIMQGIVHDSGKISVSSQGQVIASQIVLSGSLEVESGAKAHVGRLSVDGDVRLASDVNQTEHLSLLTAAHLVIGTTGAVAVTQGSHLDANHVLIQGQLSLTEHSSAVLDTMRIDGGDVSLTEAALRVDKTLGIQEGARLHVEKSDVYATKLHHQGQMDVKDSRVETTIYQTSEGSDAQFYQSSLVTKEADLNGSATFAHSSHLDANHVLVQGQLSLTEHSSAVLDTMRIDGGDVSLTEAALRVDKTLDIQEGARLRVEKSDIQATELRHQGQMDVRDSRFETIIYQTSEGSDAQFYQSSLATEKANLSGRASFEKSQVHAAQDIQLSQSLDLTLKDSDITAQHIDLSAAVTVHGQNHLQARDRLDFNNHGTVKGDGSLAFVAQQGSLVGQFSAAKALVDIQSLEGGAHNLIYAQERFTHFVPMQGLMLTTSEPIVFNRAIHRSVNLDLTATQIDVEAPVTFEQGVRFHTTEDGISIRADLKGSNIELDSQQGIRNQGALVEAKENLSLRTRGGDLVNEAGTFLGIGYLQADIHGNIYNRSGEVIQRGPWDDRKVWMPASLIGGCLQDTGIGTSIFASGEFVNDASTVLSRGSNVIQAMKGFKSQTRSHTYIAHHEEKKGWFSGKEVTETRTDFQGASVVSTEGENIVYVPEGEITGDAVSFIARQGTSLVARDDVKLRGVEDKQARVEKGYRWWGLSSKRSEASHQSMLPSQIISDEGTNTIRSIHGDVEAVDTFILSKGHLITKGRNVRLSSTKSVHDIKGVTQDVDIHCFGSTLLRGEGGMQRLWSLDPTARVVSQLFEQMSISPSTAAHAWNAGFHLYDTQRLVRDAKHLGGYGSLLRQRYGLGGSQGFDPAITLSLSRNYSREHFETLGAGAIQTRSWDCEATETVSIDGCPVTVTEDAHIKAKRLEQQGLTLSQRNARDTLNVSVTGTTRGNFVGVGADYEHEEISQTTRLNQQLHVGGVLHVDVDSWSLTDANTTAGHLEGRADSISIISQQSTSTQKRQGIQLSSTGFFSISNQHATSASVSQASGIRVNDCGTADGFTVNHLSTQAGHFVTPADSHATVGEVSGTLLVDVSHRSGFSISGNARALHQAFSQQTDDTSTSSAAIPTVTLGVLSQHQEVERRITTSSSEGAISSVSTHACTITDIDRSFSLDIPLIMPSTATKNPSIEHEQTSEQTILEASSQLTREVSVISEDAAICSDIPKIETTDRVEPQFRLHVNTEQANTETSTSQDVEVIESGFNPDTHDVKMGWKKGRHTQQTFDRKDGEYISKKGVVDKIKQQNNEREASLDIKIAAEYVLLAPEHKVYWESGWQLGNEQHVIRPMFVDDGGQGYFIAKVNTETLQAEIKLDFGRTLRLKVAQGKGSIIPFIHGEYAVDAGSVMGLLNLSASTARGVDIQASAEVGALGPNVSGSVKTAKICFLGFTLQGEASANAGVGVKAALGAGVTVDKSKLSLRPYVKCGGYLGAGAEASIALNTGIDTTFSERYSDEFQALISKPEHQKLHREILHNIKEEDEVVPSTFWGSLWSDYKKQCWQEACQEQVEHLGNQALLDTLFTVHIKEEEIMPIRIGY